MTRASLQADNAGLCPSSSTKDMDSQKMVKGGRRALEKETERGHNMRWLDPDRDTSRTEPCFEQANKKRKKATTAAPSVQNLANKRMTKPFFREDCYWMNRKGSRALCSSEKRDMDARVHHDLVSCCHQCSRYHVKHPCQSYLGCTKSYCMPCMKDYHYILAVKPKDFLCDVKEQFCKGTCPCCLNICVTKRCLYKRADTTPRNPSKEEKRLMALHIAVCLNDNVQKILDDAEQEVRKGGRFRWSLT